MRSKLIELLEEINDEKIENLSKIEDLSELDFWDSIFRVRLIVSIESEIGRSLNNEEVKTISNVKFLIELLNNK